MEHIPSFDAVKATLEDGKQYILHGAQQHPRLAAIILCLFTTLLVTRVSTTVQFYLHRARTAKAIHPIAPPVPPYSIPWIANGSYYLDLVPNIRRLAQRFPDMTAFTFHISGRKHHVIMAPSLVHTMVTNKTIIPKITLKPFIFRAIENVWGDSRSLIRSMEPKKLDNIHGYLATMMHSSFLNINVPNLTSALSTNAADLVTFSKSIVDQSIWERTSGVITTSPNTAVASLFPLIRTFTAALATDVFFSPDLLSNYPDIIDDLFLMDTKFEVFFAGFPQWTPANSGPSKARDRVVERMRQAVVAFHAWDHGKDPGSQWARIGETNSAMAGRIRGSAAVGDFDESLPEKDRGRVAALCNASILWALQVNATGIVFWLLFYAYSDPTLLQQLRAEVAPYVKIASPSDVFPGGIKEKPRLDIDGPGLRANAKLLMGAFHEVLRMETFSLTYKYLLDDIVVSESAEDAALHHRPGNPKTFALGEGDYVVVPHSLHHYDAKYFPDPEKFDARRFWVPTNSNSSSPSNNNTKKDQTEKTQLDPSQVEVSYLTAHPWGGGAQLCKGKKFAEHEVLYIAAALLHLWDFIPVSTDYLGRETEVPWRHPGRASTSATARPARDVRVRVERRGGVW
ncbi:uncharacterized protein HMPREF1541_10712 [Cyphellophora europaea CBS 101466]|uniref:Cytochrome P450 n=1 Tax=Cyphellophora europaea (strain CBS 101466) TaxID=1220924 RepID=W2S634_CYPE1|nr:uncharacterized protein HMPREF1541_10712 [Cyphellophora europaea CBS 101466]ETN44162.1 hypothetical protein HMPREF1541_10712 [Cyphellophora europaea CBS 101466]